MLTFHTFIVYINCKPRHSIRKIYNTLPHVYVSRLVLSDRLSYLVILCLYFIPCYSIPVLRSVQLYLQHFTINIYYTFLLSVCVLFLVTLYVLYFVILRLCSITCYGMHIFQDLFRLYFLIHACALNFGNPCLYFILC